MMNERNKTKTINETPAFRLGSFVLTALSANKITVGALGLLLLVSQASAAPFAFSTGDPDGKIATLSRPASPGKIQTETADDFIIVSNTTLMGRFKARTWLVALGWLGTAVMALAVLALFGSFAIG